MPEWKPSPEYLNELRNERWQPQDAAQQLATLFDWRFRLNIALSGLFVGLAIMCLAALFALLQELLGHGPLFEWATRDALMILYLAGSAGFAHAAFKFVSRAADSRTDYADYVCQFFTGTTGEG